MCFSKGLILLESLRNNAKCFVVLWLNCLYCVIFLCNILCLSHYFGSLFCVGHFLTRQMQPVAGRWVLLITATDILLTLDHFSILCFLIPCDFKMEIDCMDSKKKKKVTVYILTLILVRANEYWLHKWLKYFICHVRHAFDKMLL